MKPTKNSLANGIFQPATPQRTAQSRCVNQFVTLFKQPVEGTPMYAP